MTDDYGVTMHPWRGIVPEADVLSFRKDPGFEDRPIQAGSRPALIIVDMTRAFVDSRYPTGWSETGYPAVEANRRLLDAARRAGLPVFFTKARPGTDYRPTAAQRGRWKTSKRPELDPSLPPGDEIVEELAPLPGEAVVCKGGAASGFFGTPLASLLVYEKVDTAIVTGMTTSGCVRATVVDAFQYNLHVIVPHEACADRSQLSHAVSLFDLHMKYADVASVEATVEYLQVISRQSSVIRSSGPALTTDD
ncbi:MAG: isochorismatase family protein [Deltaproteobacteria bacterium]|nr:isochorismatase family protein [Deltaproteobacteria bacterium]